MIIRKLVKTFVDKLDSYIETREIMSDPEMVESIRRGIADMEAGRCKSLEEVKEELGL